MTRSRLLPLLTVACTAMSPALAETPPANPAPAGAPVAAAGTAIPGWDELVESLRVLPDALLAKLPPEERADPQIRAEVGRLMLAALTSSALGTLNGDGDHPAFAPLFGQALNLARPNADTIYRSAEITPGGTYRLRGRKGSVALVKIGESGAKGAGGNVYHDINALPADAQGRYDVILSPQRPAGYAGEWWKLDPAATRLSLRIVSTDWNKEEDPTFSIERADRPVSRPRAPAAELEQRLRRLPQTTAALATLRMGWISHLRSEGYLNKPTEMNYAEPGLLGGQTYYEAAYDLKDDEALIVETKLPKDCGYRSLILTTEMGETVDWINNHSSLNAAQAKADTDGVLRIVVSAKDPGVPNWLDTAGYAQGGIQGRWTDCSSQPTPVLRKIAVAEVRNFLPRDTPVVTPAERDGIVRQRRAAFLERPLW